MNESDTTNYRRIYHFFHDGENSHFMNVENGRSKFFDCDTSLNIYHRDFERLAPDSPNALSSTADSVLLYGCRWSN